MLKNMHLTFISLFKVKEMDLTILSLTNETVHITNPNDLPKEMAEWKQIAHLRKNNDWRTEFIIKASMKLECNEPIVQWMIRWAAMVVSRFMVG